MRGTRARRGHSGHGIGIIPAYAGNTNVWPFAAFLHRDHPRVCGEHSSSVWAEAPSPGSSPRMRGTPFMSSIVYIFTGIIPAYAGNTKAEAWRALRRRDHPRVCGEHSIRPAKLTGDLGSSPRMRGTLLGFLVGQEHCGIIPAYAGNTVGSGRWPDRCWDHPRVCGEHPPTVCQGVSGLGSSPRMRGTPEENVVVLNNGGIIPAYAGNTLSIFPSNAFKRDHPRVCGEHEVVTNYADAAKGSSPRMRGTQKHPRGTVGAEGIIPAYAGNTSNCHMGRALARDHPRVCGEHRQGGKYGTNGIGSSPRMRGTPSRPSWA